MKRRLLHIFLLLTVSLSAQFNNPLIIPPLVSAQNLVLTLAPSTVQFYPSITTNTFGINGNYLGPTLYINKWDSAHIDVVNNLPDSTTMHWHGLHVPSVYDGGPHMLIPPATTFENDFRILQSASTNWYHPHPHMNTLPQVTKGLAGMLIVRDSAENALVLPRTYGVDDFPIILQDRTYLPSGDFNLSSMGDSMLVNGTANAFLNLPAQVVRLRFLNGSSGRTYNIGFSDNRNFQVIASDGGMIAAPYTTNRLMISNGERYEILMNLNGQSGDSVYLMSYAAAFTNQTPGGGGFQNGSSPLNGADFNIMKFKFVAQTGTPITTIPGTLLPINPWNELNANVLRSKNVSGAGTSDMGNFPINGLAFDMNVINDTMYLDDIEVWRVSNNSNYGHPLHIHDVSFYILRRDGSPPPVYEAGLKDVILLLPGDTVDFITKFEHFTNDTIPYMFHCHNLAHEDMGMMTSFIVILPPVSVSQIQDQFKGLILYPNPANDLLNLNWLNEEENSAELIVREVSGRIVLRKTLTLNGSIAQHKLEIESLSKGMYILELSSGNKRANTRFIKF